MSTESRTIENVNKSHNKIIIQSPIVKNNRISYSYKVEGVWKEAFNLDEEFFIEYSCDIMNVPEGVVVVPLLTNVLPMAWIYDAEIIIPVCDEDFYNSVEDFKNGYIKMFPMMNFNGKLTVGKLQKNIPVLQENTSAAFFSGGVDAFNTLVSHIDEKPTLFTLWGADVKFEDVLGWERVESHLKETSQDFNIDFVTIKSSFRRFLDEGMLTRKVVKSGDGWWHGFQHGIGLIGHAAPVMYALGKKTVYLASSFTAADKGRVTCASDPTIDNFVKFCGCNVVHDGYEFARQMKIHNIIQYANRTEKHIPLRVCWESSGGSNCCNCEKCWRTILGIYAEGGNPHEYGFVYGSKQLEELAHKMRYKGNLTFETLYYDSIQKSMQTYTVKKELPKSIQWFYDVDLNQINNIPYGVKIMRKILQIKRKTQKIISGGGRLSENC